MKDNLLDFMPEDTGMNGKFTKDKLADIFEPLPQSHLRAAIKRMPTEAGKGDMKNKQKMREKLAECVLDREMLASYLSSFADNEFKFLLGMVFDSDRPLQEIVDENSIDIHQYMKDSGYRYLGKTLDENKLPFVGLISYEQGQSQVRISISTYLQSYLDYMLYQYYARFRTLESSVSKKFKKGCAQSREVFENSPVAIIALKNAGICEKPAGSKILKGIRKALRSAVRIQPFTPTAVLRRMGYDEKDADRMESAAEDLYISFFTGAFSEKDGGSPVFNMIPNDPLALYRRAVSSYMASRNVSFDFTMFAPSVRIITYDCNMDKLLKYRTERMGKLKSLLASWAKGGLSIGGKSFAWNAAIDFRQFVSNLTILENVQTDIMPPDGLEYACYKEYYTNRKWYQLQNRQELKKYLFNPFYNNLFLAFAAMGLFEISCEHLLQQKKYDDVKDVLKKISSKTPMSYYIYMGDVDANDFSNYKTDNLCYPYGQLTVIRMTELGRAVFDQDAVLKGSGSAAKLQPPVLKPSFIISMDKDDVVSAETLKPYCRQISPRLYKTGLREILSRCGSKADLDSFFKMLRSVTQKPLPPEWEDLRMKAESRFVKMRLEDYYMVYPLDGLPSELIAVIDGICRRKPYAFHMEDNRVAVRNKSVEAFFVEIKSAGFNISPEEN